MDEHDGPHSPITDLCEYRSEKRKETFVLKSMAKAETLRDLLTESLTLFNRSHERDGQVIAFALNDMLSPISPEYLDSLEGLLRNLSEKEFPE